ncbi:MAG: DNA topoisomerase IV subunit A, partial [Lentisphaerae bacterium]|nr:DNA topoisomerase IV subunit A [Lentisphaerota bacterium]
HTMQYHPHGDASITDALVAIVNRGYLIEGQGNFGNIHTGDSAAAPRYIECRLTELAREELFNDAITEFAPSYDGRGKEPLILPVKLPVLLMLGADGIAVGLSTKILSHNFKELLESQIAIIQKKPFIIMPDFPQGGLMDPSEYDHGNGKIRARAVITGKDAGKLIISELPYGVTTESVIESIEEAVRKQKVPVRSITDFTSENVEIELALKNGTDPTTAIKSLYAFTKCETSVPCRAIVLRDNRPVETDVESILRENTALLLVTLKRELELKLQNLLDALHAKTLVQIFVENRIYKKIEECKTAEAVETAIFDGLAPFRDQLRRDVTKDDIENLLGVRIRRISLFDINKNRKEIDNILKEMDITEKNLKRLNPYAVSYLTRIINKYAKDYPRKTQIASFKEIEVRELTARELEIFYDKQTGYIGTNIEGDSILHCSPYDKLMLVWDNCKYKLIQPPEKLFVGSNLIHLDLYDRDKVMTLIYTHEEFTNIKRFAFGGAIMEREYLCAPEKAKAVLFSDTPVETFYVRYAPAKGQRIHQQIFYPEQVAVKGARALGNRMTSKKIRNWSVTQPRWWEATEDSPPGTLF